MKSAHALEYFLPKPFPEGEAIAEKRRRRRSAPAGADRLRRFLPGVFPQLGKFLFCVAVTGVTTFPHAEREDYLRLLLPFSFGADGRQGLLGPERTDPDDDPTFDDNALYEIRRIEHFRRHHGVNRRALPLLCELWREIDRLKSELRFLRGP